MNPLPLDIANFAPWIEVRFSRSPGPGGQNVNKVNTRVLLLFDFESCPELTWAHRARIRSGLATRLSRDGRLRIVRHRERSQKRNRAACEEALLELLSETARSRKPRRPTRPTAASRKRRLSDKRRRGDLKRDRKSVSPRDA